MSLSGPIWSTAAISGRCMRIPILVPTVLLATAAYFTHLDNIEWWGLSRNNAITMEMLEDADNAEDGITRGWSSFRDQWKLLGHCSLSFLYYISSRVSIADVIVFLMMYIPSGLYLYTSLRAFYKISREKLYVKKAELEDLQLQVEIVNTKLCERSAQFSERAELLRRSSERLRGVRTRVRELISADDSLRTAFTPDQPVPFDFAIQMQANSASEERAFRMQLLNEYKHNKTEISDKSLENLDCGEHVQNDLNTTENSIYSSLSDGDLKKSCQVKIVKVTNMYKVAYLKQFIKQKRLRRATKQAMLKKKMESMKRLVEDWQKTLNMVINSKLSMLRFDTHPLDVASQEAMGDYSKPNLRESSDSDSEVRNEAYCDEYSLSWAQNPYTKYSYNFEDPPESPGKDFFASQEFGDVKYESPRCECNGPKGSNVLFILPEETGSQVACEETRSEPGEDCTCHDLVTL